MDVPARGMAFAPPAVSLSEYLAAREMGSGGHNATAPHHHIGFATETSQHQTEGWEMGLEH